MQHRGTRLAILCCLLAAGTLAGYLTWTAERRTRQLDDQRESKVATIDRLLSSIATIASTQQAYAEYGRRDVSSFTRVSLLVDRITTDAAGLRAAPGSTAGNERLEEFWTSLSALMGAESRAREQLASGDDSGAGETLLASSRAQVAALNASLAAFRENEDESYRSARRAMASREWTFLAVGAGLWAVGLVAFALWPLRQSVQAVDRVLLTEPAVPAPAIAAPFVVNASPSTCRQQRRFRWTSRGLLISVSFPHSWQELPTFSVPVASSSGWVPIRSSSRLPRMGTTRRCSAGYDQ